MRNSLKRAHSPPKLYRLAQAQVLAVAGRSPKHCPPSNLPAGLLSYWGTGGRWKQGGDIHVPVRCQSACHACKLAGADSTYRNKLPGTVSLAFLIYFLKLPLFQLSHPDNDATMGVFNGSVSFRFLSKSYFP